MRDVSSVLLFCALCVAPHATGQLPISALPAPPTTPGIHFLNIPAVVGTAREKFAIYVPTGNPGHHAPLVVGYHGAFGGTIQTHLENILLDLGAGPGGELSTRQWYGVAPLGRHDDSNPTQAFSSMNSQANIENVLEWMRGGYNIDTTRIYGMGFSMGGGTAASFAARHLDPGDLMFAAIVDHTGTVSLRDEYYAGGSTGLSTIFGGSPAQVPFAYARSSVIDYDSTIPLLYGARTMASNLTHIPTRIGYATSDQNTLLKHQSDVLWQASFWLYDHLDVGPDPLSGTSPWVNTSPGAGHAWDTIDNALVFSFFASVPSVTLPAAARTLCDRDARFFHFTVEQDVAGAFTPIDWEVSTTGGQTLSLQATENLNSIRAHDDTLPFNYASRLTVAVQANDGDMGRIVLDGYTGFTGAVYIGPTGGPYATSTDWSLTPNGQIHLEPTAYPTGATTHFEWILIP